ncbi:hypothetical protein FACS189437_04470 [Bacteroidia bacterium]|nr:hypothetical protein FACS189437_04470 [Bacteroidia bacterium]
MAQVSGITIERTYSGTPTWIKFDYSKYGQLLQSFFYEKGINLDIDTPNETTTKAIQEATDYKKLKKYDSVSSLLDDCLK